VEGSRIRREYPITPGRIEGHGRRGRALTADYVLEYRNTKLAVVEAKAWNEELTEGVGQAKNYAGKLAIRHAYATNGQGLYAIDLETGTEGERAAYPTPDELWAMTFPSTRSGTGDAADKASELAELWRDCFAAVPFEDKGGSHPSRYYQDISVERVLEAVASDVRRILLTLATGTGKTFIAFQISWKLFQSRWNLSREPTRRPRILFLADRNILANQAYNAFSAFPEDALIHIEPADIRKKGKVPKNGSLFFTIFQTFMASAGSATASPLPVVREPIAELVEVDVSDIRSAYEYKYILECADGSFYVGSTKELRVRLVQHQIGDGSQHTKNRRPLKLVYYETFGRIDEAFSREKQVQGWSRAKKTALIKGNISKLKQLARASAGSATAGAGAGLAGTANKFGESAGRAVPEPVEGYFGEYPPDFFDFIVIDGCHRGGANDESNWRGILDYFAPAVQLGLTATPKRRDNVDTYDYFGEPVYIYSLKEGINDGFLTPFKVKQIQTTIDYYVYTSEDAVVEGEIEAGKLYEEADFNRNIEIREREKKRVEIFLSQIHPNEKTLVFCANQAHALLVRDLVNQLKTNRDPNYCQRVTADDGALGDEHLRDFQDNEKTIPTLLTTSQKLSTGVDARNIRNIVQMGPIHSMIEFKQIIGRGTRLYDGKDYFTIYDFVKAHLHFSDPEWDGEPAEEEPCPNCGARPCVCEGAPPQPCAQCGRSPRQCPKEPCPLCGTLACVCERRRKVKVKLADGKERTIQHMMTTTFWHPDGTPMSAQQFLELLFGRLPDFFQSEAEVRALWSAPGTRVKLLQGLADSDFGHDKLVAMQQLIDAGNSDPFDVLAYVAYLLPPVTRASRADQARVNINSHFNAKQQAFLDFVLQHCVSQGVEELEQGKLNPLLRLKYHDSITDAVADLGGQPEEIGRVFADFQRHLYTESPASPD
jgi:superfamily II DNA or RNA helicase/predicted GIY-YIG superfamily endonuclease